MRVINANEVPSLAIGLQGEENCSQVVFDFADIWSQFPGGIVAIEVRRPKEDAAHPLTGLVMDDEAKTATWIVQGYDVALQGMGECQLTYAVENVVAKTKIWRTLVGRSLNVDESEPPEWQDWKNELLAISAAMANEARLMVATGEELVRTATEKAEAASKSSEEASLAATAAGISEKNASESELAAIKKAQESETASDEAKRWAECALQGADKSGFIWLDVHDDDGMAYATVSDDLDKEITLVIDESEGVLEVQVDG